MFACNVLYIRVKPGGTHGYFLKGQTVEKKQSTNCVVGGVFLSKLNIYQGSGVI